MRTILGTTLTLAAVSLLAFIVLRSESGEQNEDRTKGEVNDKRFHEILLKAAKEYKNYRPFDGTGRWSPALCIAPINQVPGGRFSASKDKSTHGRKIYVLYSNTFTIGKNYVQKDKPAKVGTTLVKEAWKPEVMNLEKLKKSQAYKEYKGQVPTATDDGKVYHATDKLTLFMMCKVDPKTPSTDQGWIYGTVSPDGKKVTSAGRVKSCMGCHTKAEHDRRFGLPMTK